MSSKSKPETISWNYVIIIMIGYLSDVLQQAPVISVADWCGEGESRR